MNNPRRHAKGRGDCFFSLPVSLLLSLAMHLVVFWPDSGSGAGASGKAGPLLARIVVDEPIAQARPVLPSPKRAAPPPAKYAGFSRSTVKSGGFSSAAASLDGDRAAGDDRGSDPLQLAEYRLALGKTLSRLIDEPLRRDLGAGVVVLELHRLPTQRLPGVDLLHCSLLPAAAQRLRELALVAAQQTPWPAAWARQELRLSLQLVVAQPDAADSCSGASACS